MVLLDVVDGLHQHAAGAAGGIVDGFALLGVEDVHHQAHHGARRVELAGLFVGGVGEFLDQVFVGLAEDVRLRRLIAEVDAGEMLDEIAQQGIGQAILVGPLRIAKNAVERFRVGLLDSAHGLLQRLADVVWPPSNILPVAIVGDLKPVVLRKLGVFLVAAGFRQRRLRIPRHAHPRCA